MIELTSGNLLTTLAFGMPGGPEWIILLVLGLLIFGRRLPEVGRSLGRGIVEFKKGIKGIEDEIDDASTQPPVGKLTEVSPPKLSQPGEAASQAPNHDVSSTTVGGEEPNPYAPKEEPSNG